MKTPELEVYQTLAGDWRWRVRHPKGHILAESTTGYRNRADCLHNYQASRETR